jgi:hypothetical protein
MPPLNLDLLDPDRDGSLERYAAQIQELVLWIRDEGHILSSIDQHFVEQWWEAGYPLESILEALRESGLRLKKRKNPPRGLPLRSMKRWVVKAGERARVGAVGRHEGEAAACETIKPEAGASGLLEGLVEDLESELAGCQPAHRHALEGARAELDHLAGQALAEPALFAALLGIGRRYYDARWESLAPSDRSERRGRISASLAAAAGMMDPESYETTVAELCRRAIRAADPLFDPQRYWSLS